MKLKQLLFGIATFIPGVNRYQVRNTGGTSSARYCYAVWLRHLVMARNNGLATNPQVVAELGPGNSLGMGLAALLSGSAKCYALDVVAHADLENNLTVFEELVTLFRARAPIPDEDEFPRANPRLDDYAFPADMLTHERLDAALEPSRLDRIRASLEDPTPPGSMVQYKVPWFDTGVIEEDRVDMIFSQAVLEHVDDLENTYRAMRRWLKPDGFISHQIDFKCHGTADEWNGHWTYSDFVWALFKGRQSFLINRQPHSAHLAAIKGEGLALRCNQTVRTKSRYELRDLAPRFRSMSDDDLVTSGAFVQAQNC